MPRFTNARIVGDKDVFLGTIHFDREGIRALDWGGSSASDAIDCEGDLLIPGVVDLHTDNLERQVQPRSNARWPSRSAMVAHDAQCAAAGVTTVLDALCVGDLGFDNDRIQTFTDGVADGDALAASGLLKSEHFLHLRCEMPAVDVLALLEPVADHPRVRMLSLMDHSPGVGQYFDLDYYRRLRTKDGLSADYVEQRIVALQEQRARYRESNRAAILERTRTRSLALASHDDRTEADIAENIRDGVTISEFPVTTAAALAARVSGMEIIAGAPNIVRGGSHSGNVAAADLVSAGLVDALASDYVPASLIEAAFACAGTGVLTLAQAIALVTEKPARMAGLMDRGRLEIGLRADMVRLRLHEGLPIVREVWRGGERVI